MEEAVHWISIAQTFPKSWALWKRSKQKSHSCDKKPYEIQISNHVGHMKNSNTQKEMNRLTQVIMITDHLSMHSKNIYIYTNKTSI